MLLVLASVGTWLFARRLGLGTAPAAVSALAFGLSAPLIDFSSHPQLDVYVLLPWLLLGTDRVARGSRGGVPFLAAALGLAALGGHPQSLVLLAPLVVAWSVLRLVTSTSDSALACRRAVLLAGAVVLGLASAAVVLLPLSELLGLASQTERGGFVGPRLSALATVAVPDVWGRPTWFATSGDPPGLANYIERTAYAGALPALVAVAGLAIRRDIVRWFFASATACSVVLAFDVPRISPWLVTQWPLRLADMGRATVLVAFCVAMLGGLGLEAILDAPTRLRRRAVAAAGLAALVPLGWIASRFQPWHSGLDGALGLLPGAEQPSSGEGAVVAATARWAVLAVASLVILLLLSLRSRWTRALGVAAVVLVAVDLIIADRGLIPVLPTDEAQLEATPAIAAAVQGQGQGRATAGSQMGGSSTLVPNVGAPYGLRDPRGRGVPVVSRTLDAWVAAGGYGAPNFAFVDPFTARGSVALRLFGVRRLLMPAGTPVPVGVGRTPAYDGPDARVWRVTDPLPRAFVACDWRVSGRSGAAATLSATTDPTELRDRPVVEGVAAPATGCAAPARPVRILRDDPTRVDVDIGGDDDIDGKEPERLVLLDTLYPGWRADVDGHRTTIAATNVAFRSVAIPAGARRVSFSYRPGSVRAGLAISFVAWIVILGLGAAALVARRRDKGAAQPAS